MARQEVTSVFSDGLMMDLNPINTPKSVLTDCLTGTFITYNGNEFVLQNDMGNYKLQNCKLPTNFIPVGVKGYADILYIVSYNPITKEVEIGSYPAPQSIFSLSEQSKTSDEALLSPFKFELLSTYQYTTEIQTQKKPIFVFQDGTNPETHKLYPGDQFQIEFDEDPLDFIYQHLNFYILDEDNKLYDIDDNEMYNGIPDDESWRRVFWETPGWLAAQYNLYVPDKFNLNLRSLNIPEFLYSTETSTHAEGELDENTQFEASMDLSAQVIITDLLFQDTLNENFDNQIFKHLYVRYNLTTTSGVIHTVEISNQEAITFDQDPVTVSVDIPCNRYYYQDDVITAFVNCKPIWWMKKPEDLSDLSSYNGHLEVKAYPIIKYPETNSVVLEYDQFATTFKFDLNNIKNLSSVDIANSIYKWSVDDDSCTVSFNINGPFINANSFTGEYIIRKLNVDAEGNITLNTEPLIEKDIPNLVLYGQNTINIAFDAPNSNTSVFVKEGGLYLLTIQLKQNGNLLQGAEKHLLLIPSSVFNDWFGSVDDYLNGITRSMWVNKYIENISIRNVTINEVDTTNTANFKYDWIQYRWSDESDFHNFFSEKQSGEDIDATAAMAKIKALYEEKFEANYDGSKWTANKVINSAVLILRFNFNSFGIDFTVDGDLTLNYEEGNLWTPKIETSLILKQNTQTLPIEFNKTFDVLNDETPDLTLVLDNTSGDTSILNTNQQGTLRRIKSRYAPYVDIAYNVYEGSTGLYTLSSASYSGDEMSIATEYQRGINSSGEAGTRIDTTRLESGKNNFIGIESSKNNTAKNFIDIAFCFPIKLRVYSSTNRPAKWWQDEKNHKGNMPNKDWLLSITKGQRAESQLQSFIIKTNVISNGKAMPCFIRCNSNVHLVQFFKCLGRLIVYNYESSLEQTNIPRLTLGEFKLEDSFTSSKADGEIKIIRLKIDGNFDLLSTDPLKFNTIKINNKQITIESGQLLDTNEIISITKQVYNWNLNPVITIQLDYTNNNSNNYWLLINSLTQFVKANQNDVLQAIDNGEDDSGSKNYKFFTAKENDDYLSELKECSDRTQTIENISSLYVIHDEDSREWWETQQNFDSFVSFTTKYNNSQDYSKNNICYNLADTSKVLKGTRNQGDTDMDPSAQIEVAYYVASELGGN